MRHFKIFVDLDEVIYDLSEYVREVVNQEFNMNYKKGFNQSYWWQDYNIPRCYFESLLSRSGTFLKGQPIQDSIKSINKLRDLGFEIHIITTPQNNKNCFFEKIRWVKMYLPWLNLDTNFHTTGNKGLMAKPDRILIDDSIHNLESWTLNKGISIAFGDYGWNKEWNGHKASDWNKVIDSILSMEDISKTTPRGIDVDKYREYIQREDD